MDGFHRATRQNGKVDDGKNHLRVEWVRLNGGLATLRCCATQPDSATDFRLKEIALLAAIRRTERQILDNK